MEQSGEELRKYHSTNGAENVLVDAFSLCNLIRDVLNPNHELISLAKQLKSIATVPDPG